LVPSVDGSDDLVGIFCPDKGLWVAVGVVDEAVDGLLKFLEGTEDAPLETPFGEQREQAFDGIEPGC